MHSLHPGVNLQPCPYMVKTLQKSSPPEPLGRFPHFVCSMGDFCSSFYTNDDPGVTLTYFMTSSNLVTSAFLWEKVKTVDFSEAIAACDLKIVRCRQLFEFKKVCEY